MVIVTTKGQILPVNKKQITTLLSAREQIKKAAEESARAEAALVTAQKEFESTSRDDGHIDPAELYDRTESARKILGTAKILADRTAAKLQELEENFISDLQAAVPEVTKSLVDSAEKTSEDLRSRITSLVVPGTEKEPEIDAFISICAGGLDRGKVEWEIRNYGRDIFQSGPSNICGAFEKAAELL